MFYHSFTIGFTEIPRVLSCLNIFTVGCPFKCEGCQNPDLQDINHKDRKELSIKELQKIIDGSKGYIQGIAWLGGEPLYQFDECISFNKQLKDLYPNFINTLFTGNVLSKIKLYESDKYQKLLYGNFDYIIDGQWNGHALGTPECNQKVYKFINNDFNEISYTDYRNKI